MRFLFVHGLEEFSLAEWTLREALLRGGPGHLEFRGLAFRPGDITSHDTFSRTVAAWRPDVVGFSCHVWSVNAFLDAARWLEHLNPGTTAILGGPQVDSLTAANAVLKENPQIDFVIRGSGEVPLKALLANLSDGVSCGQIPGVSLRVSRGVIHNPVENSRRWTRDLIFDPSNSALAQALDGVNVASYETVRGCRNHCLFCRYPGDNLAMMDLEVVARELSYLCSFSIPHLRICDAHFGGTKARAHAIFELLAQENRGTSVKIYPDLAHVDRQYLSLALESGSTVTSIGVQSTNPEALRAINRPGLEKYAESARQLLEVFPDTPADLIVGLPGDDVIGLEKTFRDILSMGFTSCNIHNLAVFPGTPLHEDLDQAFSGSPVSLSAEGRVLSSNGFPPESQQRTASLVHALELALVFRRVRGLFAESCPGWSFIDIANRLDPGSLFELHDLVHAGPASIFGNLDLILDRLERPEPDREEFRWAAFHDLMDRILVTAPQRPSRRMCWPGANGTVEVSEITAVFASGRAILCNLEKLTKAELPVAALGQKVPSHRIVFNASGREIISYLASSHGKIRISGTRQADWARQGGPW